MPLYYFDINKGSVTSDDALEMASDEAAWREAALAAGELFKDVAGNLSPGQHWKMQVLDEQKERVFSIDISSVDWTKGSFSR